MNRPGRVLLAAVACGLAIGALQPQQGRLWPGECSAGAAVLPHGDAHPPPPLHPQILNLHNPYPQQVLTLNRIKTFIKEDPEVKSISTEACFAVARATVCAGLLALLSWQEPWCYRSPHPAPANVPDCLA